MVKRLNEIERLIHSRSAVIRSEIESLKAQNPPKIPADYLRGELHNLQAISQASKNLAPIGKILSDRKSLAVVSASLAAGVVLGWAANSALSGPSSYDECVLSAAKPGMTNMATSAVIRSCRNLYKG